MNKFLRIESIYPGKFKIESINQSINQSRLVSKKRAKTERQTDRQKNRFESSPTKK